MYLLLMLAAADEEAGGNVQYEAFHIEVYGLVNGTEVLIGSRDVSSTSTLAGLRINHLMTM